MPRLALFAFFASLSVALLPALAVGCAAGDPPAEPAAAPSSTSEPTVPTPTTTSTATAPPPPSNPDDALPPVVTSISPSYGTVGSIGPSIVVSGTDFVPRSIVQLGGAPLATTFVSATELRATIPTAQLASVGVLRLSVGTSPPGGGASKEVTFEVQNPAPNLTGLTPLSVVAGAGATKLVANGASFVDGAKIVFGGTDLTTTFKSATVLEATVPPSLLGGSGAVPVKVVNPAPGGGPSTAISFTVANPAAAIQSINPSAAFVGSAAIPLVVSGSGFVPGSAVLFNGAPIPTTFATAAQLTATIPASSLGAAGDFPVAVSNPPPGGGVTAPVVFRVQYPAPQTTSLSPASVSAGAAPTVVTVTGVGFFITSQLTFDGAPAATTYVDPTHLKATLTAAQLASAGTISVRVVNSAPGGGTSAALAFTITNAPPTITALNPSTVTAGSGDKPITVSGSGFVPTSTAQSNGVPVMTTYVSPTSLTAVIPSGQMLNPGSVAVTVSNPAPGGGTSAPRYLTVGCDTTGTDVPLGAIGTTTALATSFATAATMPRFVDSSSCAATALDPANLQPARYWVVQNTAGVPVTLSAWADCSADGKNGDAYLTFYRRPTRPANDTERLACTNVISEGIAVSGFGSPESGASQWCPGLTKANGGGLTLAVCEKAVVHIQPWNVASATYTAPPTVRVKPE
ncbi:MAG: hypothetical protein JWP97_2454 [Labilithrix sp.]|nr:hypothetical protein [Labilithrix sp.]